MAEKPGPPRVLKRRHILKLSPELDEQLDRWLTIQEQKLIIEPLKATLGNPVAFPILFGVGGLIAGVLYMKYKFPDLTSAPPVLRDLAEDIAEVINAPLPNIPGVADLEQVRKNLVQGTKELLLRLWKGLTQLPPIL